MAPQILVIVRESPVAERTEALLQTLLNQEPREALRIAVLTLREPRTFPGLREASGIDELRVEDDWSEQICGLAKVSGCRWMVLPSVSDRYLPGAFQRVLQAGSEKGRSIVAPSYVRLGQERILVGPEPFHLDYFSLLTGFNYIASGATFVDIDTLLASGGFDRRFPTAATFEYLLRAGPMHGVTPCTEPVLETEANPFLGVPRDYGPLYALEVASLTLHAHRFIFTPGAALGLTTMLADHLLRHPGFHSTLLAGLLIPRLDMLKREYHAGLGICPPSTQAAAGLNISTDREAVAVPEGVPSGWRHFRSRVKAIMPTPVWNGLRRAKRVWKALLEPMPGSTI